METIKKTLKDSVAARWVVLILVSGMMFGTYWFYDVFSSLKPMMMKELGISNATFGLIYSAATWANVLGMIVVGGIILDRWGIKLAVVIFGLLVTIGAVVVAAASSDSLFGDTKTKLVVFIVGRVMFGSGVEIICTVISRTVVKWFKDRELALAMAINVGFGRLGSAMAMAFAPSIGGHKLAPSLTFAAGLVGAGFLMLLAYLIFDVRIDRQIPKSEKEEEPFRLSDLVKLITNPSFLWISLLCVMFYSAVFPFNQFAPDLLVHKFGFEYKMPAVSGSGLFEQIRIYLANAPTNGPIMAALIPFGTMLFTPIFGIIVDRKGKAASLMILGGAALTFGHTILSLSNNVNLCYVALLSLGMAFSLVPAAMWPSVAKIVPEHRLGTAYATMFTIQNFGIATVPWLIGKVLDITNKSNLSAIRAGKAHYDYRWSILMLAVFGIAAIVMAFFLKAADRKQGYGLETIKTKDASD